MESGMTVDGKLNGLLFLRLILAGPFFTLTRGLLWTSCGCPWLIPEEWCLQLSPWRERGGREGDFLLLPCPRTRATACSVLAVLTAFGPYLWETISTVPVLVTFPGEKGSCKADSVCSEVATAAHRTPGRLAPNKQAPSCLETTPASALILQSYVLPGK